MSIDYFTTTKLFSNIFKSYGLIFIMLSMFVIKLYLLIPIEFLKK